jgi:hypothetical protein
MLLTVTMRSCEWNPVRQFTIDGYQVKRNCTIQSQSYGYFRVLSDGGREVKCGFDTKCPPAASPTLVPIRSPRNIPTIIATTRNSSQIFPQNATRSLDRAGRETQQWEEHNPKQSHRRKFKSWWVKPTSRRTPAAGIQQNHPLTDSSRQLSVRNLDRISGRGPLYDVLIKCAASRLSTHNERLDICRLIAHAPDSGSRRDANRIMEHVIMDAGRCR